MNEGLENKVETAKVLAEASIGTEEHPEMPLHYNEANRVFNLNDRNYSGKPSRIIGVPYS